MTAYWCHGHKIEIHKGARFWEYAVTNSKGLPIAEGFESMATTTLADLRIRLEARVVEIANRAVPVLDKQGVS